MKRIQHLSYSDVHLLNEASGAAEIGLHDDAAAAWSKVSKKGQRSLDGLFARCGMFYHAQRYEECLATAEASPFQQLPGPWLWRIECLRKMRRHMESLGVAILALELFTKNPAVLMSVAKAFKDLGHKGRSRLLVKEAAKLDRKIAKSSPNWWNAEP